MRRRRNDGAESLLLERAAAAPADRRNAQLRRPGALAAPMPNQVHRLGDRARADEDRQAEVFEPIDQRQDRAQVLRVFDLDRRKAEDDPARPLDPLGEPLRLPARTGHNDAAARERLVTALTVRAGLHADAQPFACKAARISSAPRARSSDATRLPSASGASASPWSCARATRRPSGAATTACSCTRPCRTCA